MFIVTPMYIHTRAQIQYFRYFGSSFLRFLRMFGFSLSAPRPGDTQRTFLSEASPNLITNMLLSLVLVCVMDGIDQFSLTNSYEYD